MTARHKTVSDVRGRPTGAPPSSTIVPPEPEPQAFAASYRTKQLLLLASDLLLEQIPPGIRREETAERLISEHVLPRCYRDRYDERFLQGFRRTIELTRNLLVADTPFLPDTISELAAHAILAQARRVLESGGEGYEPQAGEIDPALADQLARQSERLAEVLDLLADTVFEDDDVLLLLEVDEPAGLEQLRLSEEDRRLLSFENWREPFGEVPRPELDDDDGAWPIAL